MSTPVRVLFVDDDPIILRAMARALGNEDFEVYFTDDAERVPELLGELRIDIIVSDEDMPGQRGLEMLALVRKLHAQSIRILLSGMADTAPFRQGLSDGVIHHFVGKPWSVQELRTLLRGAVEGVRDAKDALAQRTRGTGSFRRRIDIAA